eukprot:g11435.t1
MTTFADRGTTILSGPEDKSLTNPGPLTIEGSASIDGREAKETARLASEDARDDPLEAGVATEPAAETDGEVAKVAPQPGETVEAAAVGGASVGESTTTAAEGAVGGAEIVGDSTTMKVEEPVVDVENTGDSTNSRDDAQQDLSVSAPVSAEEPTRGAASKPRAGTAGKSRKSGKRLSLVARQSSLSSKAAELRRQSGRGGGGEGSGEVEAKGGDKPAWQRVLKPAASTAAPTSAAGKSVKSTQSTKAPKRVSLVARQTSISSAGYWGSGSGNDSDTVNRGAKLAPRKEPDPKEPVSEAKSAQRSTPRRLSLVDRQTAAAADLRSSSRRRGSDGGTSSAGGKPDAATVSGLSLVKKASARTAGENKPRRTSLVDRQAAAAAELRSKLASRKAPEREKPAAATRSSRSKGASVTKTAGKRLSLAARQSAESNSTTVVEKSSGTPAADGDCPEVLSEPVPESS